MGKGLSPPEYDELKRFLAFYSQRFMSLDALPAELRPVACLERLEQMSRSKAAEGLRQAVNDIIESTRHWDKSRVASLDAQLGEGGVVTLSELRRRFSKEFARIVKRGAISDETEYYLISGILSDGASAIAADERRMLSRLANEFEERSVAR